MKYKQRVRSRVSNLRDAKNPLLKVKVLTGEISPGRFATMPTEVNIVQFIVAEFFKVEETTRF